MTHDLHQLLAAERTREIERRAELARRNGSIRHLPEPAAGLPPSAQVAMRIATPDDRASVERLAQLDDCLAPTASLLLAEVDGRVVAAVPLDGGRAFADPFRPTAAVLELMRLRVSQLRGDRAASRGLGRLVRIRAALRRGERTAGAVAGAPRPPESGACLVR